MNKLLTMLLFAGVALLTSSFSDQGRWIIDPQSRLAIHGTTNINTFKCMLDSYDLYDTLEYISARSSIEMTLNRNRMRIPVRSFNCGNRQITKDFWQTLQSEKYPELEICFRSFRRNNITDKTYVDGVVDITLAGVTKRYLIRYFARIPNKETILLTGLQTVNFSDFKLEPPQKMMGLIQVQESLEVEFNLMLRTL
jgi:hypothetical protein